MTSVFLNTIYNKIYKRPEAEGLTGNTVIFRISVVMWLVHAERSRSLPVADSSKPTLLLHGNCSQRLPNTEENLWLSGDSTLICLKKLQHLKPDTSFPEFHVDVDFHTVCFLNHSSRNYTLPLLQKNKRKGGILCGSYYHAPHLSRYMC